MIICLTVFCLETGLLENKARLLSSHMCVHRSGDVEKRQQNGGLMEEMRWGLCLTRLLTVRPVFGREELESCEKVLRVKPRLMMCACRAYMMYRRYVFNCVVPSLATPANNRDVI